MILQFLKLTTKRRLHKTPMEEFIQQISSIHIPVIGFISKKIVDWHKNSLYNEYEHFIKLARDDEKYAMDCLRQYMILNNNQKDQKHQTGR